MTVKKFIFLLTAAAAALPSIAFAHDQFKGVENDLTCCIAVTVGISLVMMRLCEKVEKCFTKGMTIALLTLSFLASIFLSYMAILLYDEFNGFLLLALHSLIVIQAVIAYWIIFRFIRKIFCESEGASEPDNPRSP